ncbi:FMN-binding protein [Clostridium bovifaecis]|uniref:FMN-binding protein n=1 Tax=Clostridium bovifaecis TaxID=2184719 RepID=A0A6I6EJG8_9CLOT|nr:FMN-binding protein [Clostridium bovifaecis]
MKRRWLSVILASAIVSAGLFVGCGSKEEAAPTNTTKTETTTKTESALKDGKYKAEASDFDERGWKPFVEMEIKDGKIATVNFDYINKDGKFKSEDAEYNKNMEAKVKTGPAKYTKQLEDALVEKQDPATVDTIAGATHSVDNFKKLAGKAFENAKAGDTAVAKVVMGEENAAAALKDGKYKAEAKDFDDKGWKPFVEIEVKGGKIAAANFDYTNKEGKFKSEDAEYNKNMEAKVKTGPAKYTKQLEDALVEKQDPTKVDTVAGATHSVDNFRKLAGKALESAKTGDTAVTAVNMAE